MIEKTSLNKIKKNSLIVMLLLVSSINYAQNCDCSSNLKWLIATFEKNDAGFQYVIDKKGKDAYLTHNKSFIDKANITSNFNQCHKLLNDWTFFFRKKHIYIQKLKNDNSETNKELSNKPKIITQEQFENYSNYLNKNQKGFEGIWEMENYTIGIKKEGANGNYIGFITKVVNDWKLGYIKLKILKNKNNEYTANYYMGDFSLEQFSKVELISQNILRLGNIYLKREKPLGDINKTIDRYVELTDTEKPILREVSNKTLLFRIPSFHPSQKLYIDSILQKNHNKIIKTENFIIDLRNNGGGALKCIEKILPYLYTNTIKIYGYKYLSTELNNKHWKNIINNPDNSTEFKEYAKDRFKKLNNNIGSFVVSYANGFSKKDSPYFKLDTIYKNPKNIAILINENSGSSVEEFLFYAKQSKKVKLFGKKTYGILDVTDIHPIDFPTGGFRLHYSTAISMRLPEFGIDNYGIQPDFYFDKTIKPYEWIDKTIEILNYK